MISKDGQLKCCDGGCSAERIDGLRESYNTWLDDNSVNSDSKLDEGEGRTDEGL